MGLILLEIYKLQSVCVQDTLMLLPLLIYNLDLYIWPYDLAKATKLHQSIFYIHSSVKEQDLLEWGGKLRLQY